MEMQFYPPGWFVSCDTTDRWCSALTIDSLSENQNTGLGNNKACGGAVEYVNRAFITKSGVPTGPPSPLLQNANTRTPNADTLFYNSGDVLRIILEDTAHGLKITITDLTTGESGSMTASADNGFGAILYDPSGTDCNPTTHNIPYDFHPMYATSSEHTRVPWAAHSYNVAFSDELGHFEYCNAVNVEGGTALGMVCMTWITVFPPGKKTILGVLMQPLPIFWAWYRSEAAFLLTLTLTGCHISWSGLGRSPIRGRIINSTRVPCCSLVRYLRTIVRESIRTMPVLLSKLTCRGSKAIRIRLSASRFKPRRPEPRIWMRESADRRQFLSFLQYKGRGRGMHLAIRRSKHPRYKKYFWRQLYRRVWSAAAIGVSGYPARQRDRALQQFPSDILDQSLSLVRGD